jgi:hypothetical protein
MLRLLTERVGTPGGIGFIILLILLLSIFGMIQGIKRMHDLDKNGWYLFIPFYNLILALTPGTHGPNTYGQDPKSDGLEPYEPGVENPVRQNPLRMEAVAFWYVIYSVINMAIILLLQGLVYKWYQDYRYFYVVLNLTPGVFTILLAASLQNTNRRVIGIVGAVMLFLMILYSNLR